MRKFILLSFFFISITNLLFAQTENKLDDTKSQLNSNNVSYRLFPTQNVRIFIKLNTRNGKMWQVQFGMDDDNRFATNLSLDALVSLDNESNDRFTLYPTQNIYIFILLDQISGKTWQVQWSTDPRNRAVIPIELI